VQKFVQCAFFGPWLSLPTLTLLVTGKIYVVGGWASNADSAPLKTMEIYDIATDTWTAGPDTLFFHGDTCVVAANDKVGPTYCASKLALQVAAVQYR
jgi:hypothetical protein